MTEGSTPLGPRPLGRSFAEPALSAVEGLRMTASHFSPLTSHLSLLTSYFSLLTSYFLLIKYLRVILGRPVGTFSIRTAPVTTLTLLIPPPGNLPRQLAIPQSEGEPHS
jgi:hypothetical protein